MSYLSTMLAGAESGAVNSALSAIEGSNSPSVVGGAQPSGGQAPSAGTSTTSVATATSSIPWGTYAMYGGIAIAAIVVVIIIAKKA